MPSEARHDESGAAPSTAPFLFLSRRIVRVSIHIPTCSPARRPVIGGQHWARLRRAARSGSGEFGAQCLASSARPFFCAIAWTRVQAQNAFTATPVVRAVVG